MASSTCEADLFFVKQVLLIDTTIPSAPKAFLNLILQKGFPLFFITDNKKVKML